MEAARLAVFRFFLIQECQIGVVEFAEELIPADLFEFLIRRTEIQPEYARFIIALYYIMLVSAVFTVGILYLAITAGLLLIFFGGITDRLIPLFAVGAFLSFTLSQSGMAAHWWNNRHNSIGAKIRLFINGIGAVATGTAFIIIVAAKFREGAWIIILVIPAAVAFLLSIWRYYDALYLRMRSDTPFVCETKAALIIVAMEGWTDPSKYALSLAMRLAPDVIAMHVTAGPAKMR